jgi:hypothetical protein
MEPSVSNQRTLEQWRCGRPGREEDFRQLEGTTRSWRRLPQRASSAVKERMRGASTTTEELDVAVAVEEQDGTLAASPPFVFVLRRLEENRSVDDRFVSTLMRG